MRAPPAAALLVAVALAVTAMPALFVPLPSMLDYIDHVSRMWLLSGGVKLPPVSDMYAVDWTGASTNIGLDLLAVTLGPILPLEWLSSLVLVAALVLPPLGAVMLNRSLFGGWHWWQVGFAFLAWNETMLAGFINFQMGLGLALLATAADPALARRGPFAAFLSRALVAAALLVVHIFGAVFYAALLGALALGARWDVLASRRGLALAVGRATLAGLAVGAAFLLFFLFAPSLPGDHVSNPLATWWGDLRWKMVCLLTPVLTYHNGVDLLMAAVPVLIGLWALATGRLRTHAGLVLAGVGLWALGFIVPNKIAGTIQVDTRFPIMGALALAAALRPELGALAGPARRRAAVGAAFTLLALVVARAGWVGGIWEARSRTDVAAVERALALVPPGAAVLPLEHQPSREVRKSEAPLGRYMMGFQPTFESLPSLAIVRRQAFFPLIFAARGKQPLRILPGWEEISQQETGPAGVHTLLVEDPAELPPNARYLRWWRERFDYALVLNADLPDAAGPLPPVPQLELLADEGFARLYRIRRAARPASSVTSGAEPGDGPGERRGEAASAAAPVLPLAKVQP